MSVLDDPKKAKMLGVLGALAEKIASSLVRKTTADLLGSVGLKPIKE